MKNFGKLALLGAALAVSATYASATGIPLSGSVDTGGTSIPQANLAVTSSSLAFNAAAGITLAASSGVYQVGAGNTPCTDGVSNLCDIVTGAITYYSFNTSTITSSGTEIFSALASGSNPAWEFVATGYNTLLTTTASNKGSVILTGYMEDTSNSAYATDFSAYLDFEENGSGNNFTEDIVAATPEPNSLMLLGTGLLSGAGMLMRRRRLTA
jgi:hypothetical protein